MISEKQARTMILAAFWAMAMGAAQAGPVCASAEQVTAVRAALEGRPPAPLAVTAAQLGLSESVVASALPPAQAHGIAPDHFATVWKSLERWDNAVALVMHGPDVIEIEGPVGIGKPSTRSKFFNLERRDGGLAGHLRPDLYAAIYALDIPGKDGGGLRGVSFHDASGAAVFSVFLPGEGAPPTESALRQFRETAELMRALPGLCPR
jgi:putative heme iron utilization protein